MAVLVIAEVEGQTQELYDGMLAALAPLLKRARGFIAHGAGPSAGGWKTFEIWETQADATRFFAEHIHPNIPAGIKPKRTIVELHSLMIGRSNALDEHETSVPASRPA
ncbi:MAG TPA: hypothetical protein VH583_24390 [Vicinamibacterales bacterium]|jgi:hypothetical protein